VGYRTFDQFAHELLRSVNDPIQRANVFDARQAINDSYREVTQFADWQCLLDRYDIPMVTAYTTGTVTVTPGSTTVTGSGTTWVTTWYNRKIMLTGDPSEKEIAVVNSPTQLTLRYPYNGSLTTYTGLSYTIYQDTYPVPCAPGRDCIILNPTQQWARLLKFDRYTYDNRTAYNRFQTAIGPSIYTDAGTDPFPTSPTFQQARFEFWPKPTAAQDLVLKYFSNITPLSAGTDKTVMPQEFDEILIRLGTYRLKKRFAIPGWDADRTVAMQLLLQFREKNATQAAMDFQPAASLWPYNDPWALDNALTSWPGTIR
jgi:hypothetical protein